MPVLWLWVCRVRVCDVQVFGLGVCNVSAERLLLISL